MKFDGTKGKRRFKYYLILTLGLLSSCKLLVESPEKQAAVLTRFKLLNKAEPVNDSASAKIKVELRSDLVPDITSTSKNILNFSDQGQKALITALDKRAKTTDELSGLLSSSYFQDPKNDNIIDYTTKTVSLTISTQNQDFFGVLDNKFALADRLEKIRYHVQLDREDILQFQSWNKVNTQVGRFYIGNRSYTGSQTGTLNPSLTVGVVTASAGSLAGTNQYIETDTLSEQFMSSNGILHDYDFTIEQDGTAKTTLMGNTIIQLTLKAKNIASEPCVVIDNLTDKDDKPNDAAKIKVSFKTILFPAGSESKNLTGTLSFDYVLRHVDKGFNTYAESDDTVSYYYGTIKNQPVNIVMGKNLRPKLYSLTFGNKFLKIKNINIADSEPQSSDLFFLSYEAAKDFLDWILKTAPNTSKEIILGNKYKLFIQGNSDQLKTLNKTVSLNDPRFIVLPN